MPPRRMSFSRAVEGGTVKSRGGACSWTDREGTAPLRSRLGFAVVDWDDVGRCCGGRIGRVEQSLAAAIGHPECIVTYGSLLVL